MRRDGGMVLSGGLGAVALLECRVPEFPRRPGNAGRTTLGEVSMCRAANRGRGRLRARQPPSSAFGTFSPRRCGAGGRRGTTERAAQLPGTTERAARLPGTTERAARLPGTTERAA